MRYLALQIFALLFLGLHLKIVCLVFIVGALLGSVLSSASLAVVAGSYVL